MTLLATAQAFANAGFCVIPTAPDGTKRPALSWREYQHHHPTPEQIWTWFAGQHYDGLGLVCGTVSGGLEMLELEGRAAHLAGELAQLLADHDAADLWQRLCTGYVERTPSGGLHWLYRIQATDDETPRGNRKLARRPGPTDPTTGRPTVDVLIETRGEGGYVVTAPSAGRTHPTGQPWTMVAGGPATIPTITADERDLLHAVASLLDQMPTDPAPTTTSASSERPAHDSTRDGLRPGDEYNAKTDLFTDLLQPAGWTISKRFHDGSIGITRPGKKARDGISATIRTTDGIQRLYVFSSSTEFDTEIPYTPLGALAVLEHGGDHSAAARDLRGRGYGDQTPTGPALTFQGRPEPATPYAGAARPADPERQPAITMERSEDGHAQMLIEQFGHLIRFCPERNRWLTWSGQRWMWEPGRGGQVREYAKDVARRWDASDSKAVAIKRRMLSAAGISGALDMASTEASVTVPYDQLDADPWALNTPAGIVNLRTGALTPSDPHALCTRMTAASPDPGADPARWSKFLADTFDDPDLIAYMQRLVGYSAIGYVGPHRLPFCHGSGGNGKGAFLEATTKVLGDYATTAPLGFLMAKAYSSHETEIARLSGARMVLCSEVNEGDRFDEAKVKLLAGGDTLTARFMKQDHFTFTPTHQLWLLGNSKPLVQTGGRAFWRRLRLIPFEHEVTEENIVDDLQGILAREHGAALMNWIIAGAVEYAHGGLRDPQTVIDATADYAHDQDTVERFLEDMCVQGDPTTYVSAIAAVRRSYLGWCLTEGHEPLSGKAFGIALQRRGINTKKGAKGVRQYTGILLMATGDGPDEPPLRDEDAPPHQGAFWDEVYR